MRAAGGSIGGPETVVLTAAAAFADSVFIVPRLLVADAGRAGIVALLLLSLAAIAWAAIVAGRARKVAQRSLPLALATRGGIFGRGWLIVLAGFEVLIAAAVVLQYTSMAVAIILPGESRLAISAVITVAAFTAARHRIQGLARTVFVSFLFAGILAAAAFALLLARAEQLASVLPGPHLRPGPILIGAFDSAVLYAGVTSIVTFLPAHRPSRWIPSVVGGTVLVSLLVLVAYVAAVATGGPAYVLTQIWPVVAALRTLVLASFVLNRLGLVVVLTWSAFVLTFAAIHLWAAAEYTCIAIGSDRRRPLVALAASALVLAFSAFAGSQADAGTLLRVVIDPAVVAVFATWLVLAFLLTRRRTQAARG